MAILKNVEMNVDLENPFLHKEELNALVAVIDRIVDMYSKTERVKRPLERGSFLMDGQPVDRESNEYRYESADSVLSFTLKNGVSGGSLVSATMDSEEETRRVIDRALVQLVQQRFNIIQGTTSSAISYYADSSLFLIFETAYGRFLAMFYASYNDVPGLYPLQTTIYLAIAKALAVMREWDWSADKSCKELFYTEAVRSERPGEYDWINTEVERYLKHGRKRALVAWREWLNGRDKSCRRDYFD